MHVIADLGSTFTKMMCVDDRGEILGSVAVPTQRESLDQGFENARMQLARNVDSEVLDVSPQLCSSAAGGLRLLAIGLEPELTVRFARMAAASAGGRIAGALSVAEFAELRREDLDDLAPDIIIMTGGTDGGDEDALRRAGRDLLRLRVSCPIVIAGNQEVYGELRDSLSECETVIFAPNIMPSLGETNFEPVRTHVRELFISHVIGRGRFASASTLQGNIVMPTPDAVLAGAEMLATMSAEYPLLAAPVVVDVGGATTDIHSVMPAPISGAAGPTHGRSSLRSVEADLGMRESSRSLVDAAITQGWLNTEALRFGADERVSDRAFLPATENERRDDRHIGLLAAGIGVARHAGEMSVQLRPGGVAVTLTGRDLRKMSSVVATGGIFRHIQAPQRTLQSAVRIAHSKGHLVPDARIPVIVDNNYVLWAAGILSTVNRQTSARLLERQLLEERGA